MTFLPVPFALPLLVLLLACGTSPITFPLPELRREKTFGWKTSRLPPHGDILRILAVWYKWWITETKHNHFRCLLKTSSRHAQYCNIQRWT